MSEQIGLGASGEPVDSSISFESIWKHMVEKIYHPDRFLPVTNVTAIDKDGYVYREMTAPDHRVVKENIYRDEETGKIRFVATDRDEVVINQFHKDTRVIEYWLENNAGQRINWPFLKKPVLDSINKTIEFAKSDP
eukprot:TRINITY_DN310_c0_g1_i2.p1 TRINITY_DN310_c0_g1~~TRINITY_DN310_c0_g1_i2.p1  ORF type:complete len:136 (+),score=37.64 TRINITY_DN310_c0_g1_i2:33-440(+)